MCGITFIVNKQQQAVDESLLLRANRSLQHRGPDEQSIYLWENWGIAFSRLALVDSKGGSQPLMNEDGRLILVCNGEIYNHLELRAELQRLGHHFSSHSDSEVILHLYEECPDTFVEQLSGMYAFILIDLNKKTVFIARDRVGMKPLFVYEDQNYLVFSSEVKGILSTGLAPCTFNHQSIYDFFQFNYIPGEATLFEGIEHIAPAELWILDLPLSQYTKKPYWQPEIPKDGVAFSGKKGFISLLQETLTESVSTHMQGDGDVAAYLSGGIDSTAVAMTLNELLQGKKALSSFSIAFPGFSEFDESSSFKKTADFYHFDAHTLNATQPDAALLQEVLYHLEQPQSSLMDVSLFALARTVRESGYKVALAGEGADELLGGYSVFKLHQMYLLLSKLRMPFIVNWFLTKWIGSDLLSKEEARLMQYQLNKDLPLITDLLGTVPAWYPVWAFNSFSSRSLFLADYPFIAASGSALQRLCAPLKDTYQYCDEFHKSIYIELKTRLPNYILSRSDRLSMAHGVELRMPFLANEMIEVLLAVPWMLKLFFFKEKYIEYQSFKKKLPPHFAKKSKQGFNAPMGTFFDVPDDLRDYCLSKERIDSLGVFRSEAVEALRKQRVQPITKQRKQHLEAQLLGVLSVQLLHERFNGSF